MLVALEFAHGSKVRVGSTFAFVKRDLDPGYSASAAGVGVSFCCIGGPCAVEVEDFLVLGVCGGGVDVEVVDGVSLVGPP